jgi:hypothetical protein
MAQNKKCRLYLYKILAALKLACNKKIVIIEP